MYTLRCTRRLLSKLPHETTASAPPATTILGDWYANVLNIGSARLILCTNERSLLSVIVPAKNPAQLPIRLRDAAVALFRRLGYPEEAIAHEERAMAELVVGPTANRSVLGSMTDITWHCRWYAEDHAVVDLRDLELRLADMPMLSQEPAAPEDRAAALLLAGTLH